MLRKTPVREQDPKERAANFKEVYPGYSQEEAREEASRYINCKNARCIQGRPAVINIPKFAVEVKEGKLGDTANTIAESSVLPAVCGHIYPQEGQYESKCARSIRGEPIPIGELEHFVADWSREDRFVPAKSEKTNGIKVAVIGSGLTRLICVDDLAEMGYEVAIFEAPHEPDGAFTYGIPELRFSKPGIVWPEADNVRKLSVKIETNIIIGKSVTVDELMDEEGYKAIFISSGVGLPKFTGVPSKNANGVSSVNKCLTRSNLIKAFHDDYDTPIHLGKKMAVIGGGNVAVNAARTVLRLGAGVHIVYRRNEAELPARVEEVYHAKEGGIIFNLLINPVETPAGDNGQVKGVAACKMESDEPDVSDRRRPVEAARSNYTIGADTITMSLGTSPNPLISSTIEGLETSEWKCIIADGSSGKTTKEGVYTGGNAVTGAAIVIPAMEVGRADARGIDEYLNGNK